MKLTNIQNMCLLCFVVVLVLLIILVVKNRSCPCSNSREGFESNGIPNEMLAQIRNIENELNQKLNDHESRISKLESGQ